MKKLLILFFLFFLTTTACADDFTMAGYLKNEFAFGMDTLNDVHKFKNVVSLSGEYTINNDWTMFTSAKYWYDVAYEMYEKYDPAKHYMGHVQRADWLRDCYLDYTTDILDIRLGKQQVVWGQADGIPILDRINPFDLTEYWLPDFKDLRIPLWMININYAPKVNSVLQLLVIPDFEQSTSAPPEAPLAFRSYKLFDAFVKGQRALGRTFDLDVEIPPKQFSNSTFGVQWSDSIGELQYTLNFLHGYYYSARTYAVETMPPFSRWYYQRRFKLYRIYGGSFNRTFTNPGPLQGITLRGDVAYYNNEPTYYGDVSAGSTKGINRWDNWFWLIGADKYLRTNWLLSVQFAQYILQDAKPGKPNTTPGGKPYENMSAYSYGAQDQVENIISAKLSTDFMSERLKTELFWTATDDGQGRVSPKIHYEIRDDLWLTTGLHYFYGKETDSNGQFRDKSQIFLNLTYTF